MSETEFLLWVRGPGLQIASIIFVLGVVVRLFEILILGRARNLAEPRGSAVMGGLRTIATRSPPIASRVASAWPARAPPSNTTTARVKEIGAGRAGAEPAVAGALCSYSQGSQVRVARLATMTPTAVKTPSWARPVELENTSAR